MVGRVKGMESLARELNEVEGRLAFTDGECWPKGKVGKMLSDAAEKNALVCPAGRAFSLIPSNLRARRAAVC